LYKLETDKLQKHRSNFSVKIFVVSTCVISATIRTLNRQQMSEANYF